MRIARFFKDKTYAIFHEPCGRETLPGYAGMIISSEVLKQKLVVESDSETERSLAFQHFTVSCSVDIAQWHVGEIPGRPEGASIEHNMGRRILGPGRIAAADRADVKGGRKAGWLGNSRRISMRVKISSKYSLT